MSYILTLITKLDQYIAFLSYDNVHHDFYGHWYFWCTLIYQAIPYCVLLVLMMPILLFFTKKYSKKVLIKFIIITYVSLFLSVGVMVNLVLKTYYGRPRPRQFVADATMYRDFWQPNWHESELDNSFPSGHASVGFYLFLPIYTLTREKKYLLFSILTGALVGIVRILQGGHYFTDVLFAGVIVFAVHYVVMLLVDKFYKI
jgi:lipid A 4'-phosphatase